MFPWLKTTGFDAKLKTPETATRLYKQGIMFILKGIENVAVLSFIADKQLTCVSFVNTKSDSTVDSQVLNCKKHSHRLSNFVAQRQRIRSNGVKVLQNEYCQLCVILKDRNMEVYYI